VAEKPIPNPIVYHTIGRRLVTHSGQGKVEWMQENKHPEYARGRSVGIREGIQTAKELLGRAKAALDTDAALKGKRQGWLDAEEKYLPLLKGMYELVAVLNMDAEHLVTDEDAALYMQVAKLFLTEEVEK